MNNYEKYESSYLICSLVLAVIGIALIIDGIPNNIIKLIIGTILVIISLVALCIKKLC